jgi:nucleotide-binding universal stress UspA family protein
MAECLGFRNILVPVDFSDGSAAALECAASFAAMFNAKVVLLHVVEPLLFPGSYPSSPSAMHDTTNRAIQAGKARLKLLGKNLGELRVETLVRLGRAPSEIPETARALGCDLIIIPAQGAQDAKHLLMGSTTERVISHSPCPVLTIPTGCRKARQRLAAALEAQTPRHKRKTN